MKNVDRNKLDTLIEKEVYRLVFQITEHAYDFTHIYCMRNKIDIDRGVMEQVLKIVKLAVQDGYGSKIAMFHTNISKVLDEYTMTENPTEPGVAAPAPKGKRG